MENIIKAGSFVQIKQIVLPAGKRAPQVPSDTQRVPLELRVKGFLVQDSFVGEEVLIRTFTGRELKGVLEDSDPSYEHKYGRPIPEILSIGGELRAILKEGEVC